MFTFLAFALRYPLRGTISDIISLFPLSSLPDFHRFITSVVIFSGSVSLLISLVRQWMMIFSGFFSMVGLGYQCMWLIAAPLNDFPTTFCLSFESSHPFKSLTIESIKITVTFSYFFISCCVFYGDDSWICWFFPCVITIFFTWIGFVWVGSFRRFYIIPVLHSFSISPLFDNSWHWLDVDTYASFGEWFSEHRTYLFGTLKSILLGPVVAVVCCHCQVVSV